ncbi:hypothetical protein [Cytobacillus sp. IB215316]|uniref:hypothetical protein n=1 Tax=Cytobacillus sp. IB215316 TaxID=3097354 RepID=UPI002A137D24|nr:hypothetical protein [Cytobacillus sp. IB215316]MDX8362975.1 hypothetical protein [Cytobacillus sp. IB215316]
MLETPLGHIKLFVNENEVDFTPIKLEKMDLLSPDVNGRYLIQYNYKTEYKNQTIKCCLPSLNIKGDIQSGERLESIAYYKNDIKLSIGADGEFVDDPYHDPYFDFTGEYLSNGIEYQTTKITKDKVFQFGICWIQPCTDENDDQTWCGADPNIMLGV